MLFVAILLYCCCVGYGFDVKLVHSLLVRVLFLQDFLPNLTQPVHLPPYDLKIDYVCGEFIFTRQPNNTLSVYKITRSITGLLQRDFEFEMPEGYIPRCLCIDS